MEEDAITVPKKTGLKLSLERILVGVAIGSILTIGGNVVHFYADKDNSIIQKIICRYTDEILYWECNYKD